MSDLLRLVRLLRPHAPAMAGGVGLALVVVLANVGLLALSGWFIAAMALAGLGRLSLDVFAPAAAIRGLAILRTGGRYGERLVLHDAMLRILATLRVFLFARLEPLAPAALQRYRGGDLLARLRADVDSLDNLYIRVAAPFLTAAIGAGLMLAFLAWYAPSLTLLDGAALAVAGLALPLAARRLARGPGAEAVAARADVAAGTTQLVRGLGELMVHGAVAGQVASIDAAGGALVAARRRQARLDAVAGALSGLTAHGALAGSLLLVMPAIAAGALPPPDLPMLALFVLAGFEAVAPLPAALASLGETLAAARRIFALVDAAPAVREPAAPALPPRRFDIRVEGLRLRYAADAPWVLDRLNLNLPAGHSLGISGASGAGKTSLLDVLLRFFEFQEGDIQIGGVSIRTLESDTVRALFSVVAQGSHLFNASIRDNLLVAAPGADDAALYAALSAASLLTEVKAMEDGLDTMVGELGMRLSGGQARRLVIARAVLKDAPILLLDEPTEGLDAMSETLVLDALSRLMRGRTTIVVSHRPQALRRADAIALMRGGRVELSATRCSQDLPMPAYGKQAWVECEDKNECSLKLDLASQGSKCVWPPQD